MQANEKALAPDEYLMPDGATRKEETKEKHNLTVSIKRFDTEFPSLLMSPWYSI